MAKELVFSAEEVNAAVGTNAESIEVLYAINQLLNATQDTIDEAKKLVVAKKNQIAEMWRKSKELEKILKIFKENVEAAIGLFTDEEGNVGAFEGTFKWRKGATTSNVNDVTTLFRIAEGNGVSLDEIAAYMKAVNVKDAAKMLGMSDEAFCKHYGEIVETKTNKPTLVGI